MLDTIPKENDELFIKNNCAKVQGDNKKALRQPVQCVAWCDCIGHLPVKLAWPWGHYLATEENTFTE